MGCIAINWQPAFQSAVPFRGVRSPGRPLEQWQSPGDFYDNSSLTGEYLQNAVSGRVASVRFYRIVNLMVNVIVPA